MTLQVLNSPFNQEQVDLLGKLLPTLTGTQQIWLSGYLTALQAAAPVAPGAVPAAASASVAVADRPAPVSKEVTVLFGSQTGNSQGLAKKLAQQLEGRGYQVALSVMRDFKPNTLKKVRNLLIIVSTQGEGDPPDNAMSFYEFLHSKRAPQLDELRYSVLALGDTSYEQFCQTGKDFDKRLGELGGQLISPRVDCDVDYDEPAAAWMESVIANLEAAQQVAAASVPASSAGAFALAGAAVPAESSPYSRTNPFQAEVLDNINLNGRGSDLETRHLALSLEGSGLQFEPGDVVGIYPENDPELVGGLIRQFGWNPNELVPANKQGELCKLKEAFTAHYDISTLSRNLLEAVAPLSGNDKLRELVLPGREQDLKAYVKGRDLLDLAEDFAPWQATPGEFVSHLRKLPARQYSIASSLKANPDEVHLTIRAVRYEAHGRVRRGVCSTYVADRLQPGDKLPIYIQKNEHFRLPANPDAPIIMIGPGTGVAPFRAFMEERAETEASGKSWLFYGDRRFLTDFLYQVEWQRWLKDGVLTRMDVAFSRDTDKKVYVQHRMLEKSKDLYAWLQEGATVYVCGDKDHMAKDVHETLIAIVEKEGGKSREAAEAYIADLQQNNRYQRDVY